MTRADPVIISLSRCFYFTVSALLVGVTAHLLTFDVSKSAASANLKSPVVMFAALVFSIGITGCVGSLLGFYSVLRGRVLHVSRVLGLGALFGIVAFSFFHRVLELTGIVGGAATYVGLAAALAAIGGRLLSGNSADTASS